MPTVTINGTDYETYVDVATVDAYANGSTTAMDTWGGLDDDGKARAVVTATRWIDSQCWQGEKLDAAQPLAFPRTVGDIVLVEQATVLLSIILAGTPDAADQTLGVVASGEANGGTKVLKAGSVSIEYFRALDFTIYGAGRIDPFPDAIMRLIGAWLCENVAGGVSSLGAPSAFGVHKPSVLGYCGRFKMDEPL